jgi:hypothetical protein
MRSHRGILGAVLIVSAREAAIAQTSKQYDVSPTVFGNRIEAVFPGPYFLAVRPNPPLLGYYAWKLVFGDGDATVVLRTDSAIASSDNRQVVRSARLYACEKPLQPMLECRTRIGGSAKADNASVTLEITEPSVVRLIRALRPSTVTRQSFEPGGRFRVDQLPVSYRVVPP